MRCQYSAKLSDMYKSLILWCIHHFRKRCNNALVVVISCQQHTTHHWQVNIPWYVLMYGCMAQQGNSQITSPLPRRSRRYSHRCPAILLNSVKFNKRLLLMCDAAWATHSSIILSNYRHSTCLGECEEWPHPSLFPRPKVVSGVIWRHSSSRWRPYSHYSHCMSASIMSSADWPLPPIRIIPVLSCSKLVTL